MPHVDVETSAETGGTWTRGEEKNPRGPPKVLPVNAQVQSLKGRRIVVWGEQFFQKIQWM